MTLFKPNKPFHIHANGTGDDASFIAMGAKIDIVELGGFHASWKFQKKNEAKTLFQDLTRALEIEKFSGYVEFEAEVRRGCFGDKFAPELCHELRIERSDEISRASEVHISLDAEIQIPHEFLKLHCVKVKKDHGWRNLLTFPSSISDCKIFYEYAICKLRGSQIRDWKIKEERTIALSRTKSQIHIPTCFCIVRNK